MTGCLPSPEEMVIDYEASEYYLVGDLLKQYKNSSLKQVAVSNTEISDAIIGYICRHCDNLEYILLDGCFRLTDAGVNSIAMHCPNLAMLNLSCCNITDVSLQSLAVHLSVQVKKSSKPRPVSYSTFSEYQPIPRSANLAGSFSVIILSGCSNITKVGVLLLANKCTNLNSIVLDGCARFGLFIFTFRITDWYYDDQEEPKSAKLLDDIKEDGESDTASFKSAVSEVDGIRTRPSSPAPRPLSVNRKQLLTRFTINQMI
jgi:hypothetical protein